MFGFGRPYRAAGQRHAPSAGPPPAAAQAEPPQRVAPPGGEQLDHPDAGGRRGRVPGGRTTAGRSSHPHDREKHV